MAGGSSCKRRQASRSWRQTAATPRTVSDTFWLSYGWTGDGTKIYGLQPTEDQQHFMLVALDLRSGRERVANANLGLIPHANQPIRGFGRVGDRAFVTSVARVRSDIWLLEDFLPAPTLWQRLWPGRGRRERRSPRFAKFQGLSE